MRIAVLGPLEVLTDHSVPVAVPGPTERLLLAVLTAGAPGVVTTAQLLAVLPDAADPLEQLRTSLRRLRLALEPHLPERSSGQYVLRRGGGYVLAVGRGDIDALRVGSLVARGRAELAAGDAAEAELLLGAALHLWRGEPYAEWPDAEFATGERRRLTDVRADAVGLVEEARSRPRRERPARPRTAEPVHSAPAPAPVHSAPAPVHSAPAPRPASVRPLPAPAEPSVAAGRSHGADPAAEARPAGPAAGTAAPASRTRRAVLVGGLVAALAVAGLTVRAQEKSDDRHASAAPRSTASDAERLATLSRSDLPLDVSLLLAAEAVRLDDTPDTHGQLMAALGGLGRVERVVPFDGVPGEPALSGRGRTLTFRAGDSIVVWSAASELQPHVLIPLPGDWGAWTIASPSPVDAVVVGAGENLAGPWLRTVSTADGASHLIAEGAQLKGRPVDAAVSADGRRVLVLVAEPDGETRSNTTRWRVLDVDLADGTRRETGISGVFPAPPDDLAGDFADDAGSLVVWDAAGTVPATLIDLASGRRTPVAAHSRRAVSTEFRALPSGAVRLWDDGVISRIDSRGTTVQNLIFHVGQVRDVVAPPGANWAVTVGDGGWVVRWDVDPTSGVWGRPERLSGHGGSVIGAEADPDGQRLYTVSLDGRVITWDMRDLGGIEGDRALRMPFMDTEAALAEACAVVGRDLTRAEWAQYLPGRPWQRTCSQNQWEVALGLAGDHRGHGTG